MKRLDAAKSFFSLKTISRINFKLVLILFMLSFAQTLWWGYGFAVGDHAIQTPIIRHIMHPNLYPNDTMIQETAGSFNSFFTYFIAVLTMIFRNMPIIYFTVHSVAMFGFLMVVYYLSLELFKDRTAAAISVIFMLLNKLVLGKGGIHYTSMDHTFILFPLGLLGVLMYLKGKRALGFAIVGITFNFHGLTGTYSFSILTICTVLSSMGRSWQHYRDKDSSTDFRTIWLKDTLFPISMFVAFGLPTIVWSILKSSGPMTDEWVRLLRLRSSPHSFPFSWPKARFIDYLLFMSLGAIAATRPPEKRLHTKILLFALGVAILCGMGTVFTELHPVKIILRLQLFRSTTYLTVFMLIYIAHYIAVSWSRSAFHKVGIVVTFLSIFFLNAYFSFAPLAILLLLFAEWVLPGREEKSPYFVYLLFVIFALVFRIYAPHTALPTAFSSATITGFFSKAFEDRLIFILLCMGIVVAWKDRIPVSIARKLVTAVIVLILAFYVVPSGFHRLHPADWKKATWYDVQFWAKDNTPIDAMFIVPPATSGFRIFSERSIVADIKDGTQQYFNTEYAYEWWRRMLDLGGYGDKDYNKLTEEDYAGLAKKYGATHLLVPASRSLNMDKVYQNKDYAVYKF